MATLLELSIVDAWYVVVPFNIIVYLVVFSFLGFYCVLYMLQLWCQNFSFDLFPSLLTLMFPTRRTRIEEQNTIILMLLWIFFLLPMFPYYESLFGVFTSVLLFFFVRCLNTWILMQLLICFFQYSWVLITYQWT